jgi:monovalent cation/hydrogen antiporter
MSGMAGGSLSDLGLAALLVSIVVIVTRFVWIFPATYLPRWLIPSVRRKDPAPPWQWPFAIGYTGVRGIVSLAAALALPLATDNGEPFPHRALIIFLVFFVILVTLVGQGSMLPLLIRWLGLAHAGRRERHARRAQETMAWHKTTEAAIERLTQFAKERELPEDVVRPLRAYYRERLSSVDHRDEEKHHRQIELSDEIALLLIDTERQLINSLYRAGELEDDARRRMERALDLRAEEIANQQPEES